ncbi:MAG TPA: TetR/AcrR family transcriptional regulator [Solirubrobacteraceae bacterium]|nr:TetR/AcrR family transcriptional regulator [Solirubrobacteraceae bacterium]
MLRTSNGRPGAGGEPLVQTALAERPLDPRRRILDALVQTVYERGYDRTTVERTLQLADVPAEVFDEHFHDKEDCFVQAIDEIIGEAECIVLAQFTQQMPWAERVRVSLSALLWALAANPQAARVAIVESLGAGAAASERYRSALSIFVPLLEEGMPHAAYSQHLPPQTSEAIVGGIAAIVHRRVLEHRTHELPELIPDIVYFALLPYLGHHRAQRVARTPVAV